MMVEWWWTPRSTKEKHKFDTKFVIGIYWLTKKKRSKLSLNSKRLIYKFGFEDVPKHQISLYPTMPEQIPLHDDRL